MSKFNVCDKIIVTNYDSDKDFPFTLNGKLGEIEDIGLDDIYYVKIGNRRYCIADHEMVLASKDNQLNVGSQVIVINENSSFHNQIGIIEDIRYQLEDSSYRYYTRFSKGDDCTFLFTVNEISLFNLSFLFSQITTDILS